MDNMEMVIFYTTFIPMGAMYLHARTFFTLADTTSVQCIYMQECSVHSLVWLIYLWVRCIYIQECSAHSDTILYPLQALIFTVITEVWQSVNRARVTNNLTVIIEVR